MRLFRRKTCSPLIIQLRGYNPCDRAIKPFVVGRNISWGESSHGEWSKMTAFWGKGKVWDCRKRILFDALESCDMHWGIVQQYHSLPSSLAAHPKCCPTDVLNIPELFFLTFGTEFVDFIPDLSLKITHPFKISHQYLHGWCVLWAMHAYCYRAWCRFEVLSHSLCGKTMWEQDFHSDMLVYTLQWLLGLLLCLCFHFEISEPKLWCRQKEWLVDCEDKTKATEPRSACGGISRHQGVWQQTWAVLPAVNGS